MKYFCLCIAECAEIQITLNLSMEIKFINPWISGFGVKLKLKWKNRLRAYPTLPAETSIGSHPAEHHSESQTSPEWASVPSASSKVPLTPSRFSCIAGCRLTRSSTRLSAIGQTSPRPRGVIHTGVHLTSIQPGDVCLTSRSFACIFLATRRNVEPQGYGARIGT